ncbi:sirohydrochlorin ferrochelatase [Spinactinospora alkalitolerans]|uniref:Sirohydrochlorin ferrochelatase n=1 Tax=Spinactinospora alkalitolerans TaxID=687207 RepID=A0A852TVA5_9ACTN|nr:sirohydrochlorin chelatase [Spinactinospora alkalitolerans]NYE46802.1 sirohydrochlorin ferrochelatase [Spinactinospora alkalitolerans]
MNPQTTDTDVPLIAVAHGSKDARSARAVGALFDRVRRLRPGLDVRVAYLDHVAPDPEAAIGRLAAEGAGEVVVLPALLTAAYHSKTDLPQALARVRAAFPWLRVRYGDTLGPHPLLEEAVLRRLAEADVAAAPDTALVLASAGSSDAGANAVIEEMAARLAARGAWRAVVPAYASAASPTPGEAVARLRAAGAPRVAVATYLLAPGFFSDRVAEQAFAAGAAAVSPALGDCPESARVVLERYDEALAQSPRHRVPVR